jgi:hypothetical protein
MKYRYLISPTLLFTVFATLSCNSGDTVGSGEGDGRSCSPSDVPFPCAVGMDWTFPVGRTNQINWNGNDSGGGSVSAGVYIVTIEADAERYSLKLVKK